MMKYAFRAFSVLFIVVSMCVLVENVAMELPLILHIMLLALSTGMLILSAVLWVLGGETE